MHYIDSTHREVRKAFDDILRRYLYQGLREGKTGTEWIYYDLDRKWHVLNWDKLRALYAPCTGEEWYAKAFNAKPRRMSEPEIDRRTHEVMAG